MIQTISLTRLTARLLFLVPFAAFLCNPTPGLAKGKASAPSLGSASSFAVLGGPAVTCTDSGAANTITDVTGDVGVLLGTGFTNTGCTIDGTVHAGDGTAAAAYAAFLIAHNNLAPLNTPSTCDRVHTLTGPLAGLVLLPGVYCVDAAAKAGLLTLNGDGDENAVWIFLVNGALTGTGFNVQMFDGGEACNVYWWVKDAATMTTSNFLGTILAGAAITVTGGTIDGRALATAAVTLTDTKVTGCGPGFGDGPPMDKCEPRDDEDDDDDDDGDDDHDGHHGGRHDHKNGHGHHHDKDDDHEDNNRNARGSGSKGKKRG